MRKFLLFVALAGLLAVGGPVSPVAAVGGGSALVTDPDTDGVAAAGDITGASIVHETTVTVRVIVQTPEDPATSANWKDSADTLISWLLETNGDDTEEFEAVLFAEPDGTVVGELYTAGGAPLCTSSVQGGYIANGYQVSFPRSCLGDPANIRFTALMAYDTTPAVDSDAPQIDEAPDTGWSSLASAPSTGADRPVRVGVVGLNDNQVWVGHGNGALYEPLGGQAVAPPAVASINSGDPASNRKPVFVVTGSDNQLWIRTADVPWRLLSDARTHCIGNPAALVYDQVGGGGQQQLAVACRGSDNALWTSVGPITLTTLPKLNAWTRVGGVLTAGPSVGVSHQAAKAVTYLVVGVGGRVYQSLGTGFSPTPWTCKDHVAFGSLNDISWFGCRGSDDGLWAAKNTPSGWGNAFPLGGRLVAGPGVAVTGSAAVFFVQGTDNGVWQTIVQNGDHSRTPFSPNGGRVKFGVTATSL